ncbi:MAG: DUF4129 domain-containing protein [Pirellulales bacterium]|nr:DUF4129 domain-containing protein [Pirellulales bacterium]
MATQAWPWHPQLFNSQFEMLAVEDPVQSGRESLERWWGYPWYDSDADDVKRIEVAEPWDWSWLRGLPLGEIVQWLAWIALAVALIAIVYVLVRMYLRRLKEPKPSAAGAAEDPAARQRIDALPFSAAGWSDLLGEARRLYEAGDYDRAIVFLFSFQLVQLDRRQLIRLARGKTNRQYLRELGSRASLRALLTRTMVCFEDVFFGHRTLDRTRFDSCWTKLDEFLVLAEG